MSLLIKPLTLGTPVNVNDEIAAPNDFFNLLENANIVYDLYIAPNTSPEVRSAIVKSIRLVNTHASTTIKVTLWFNKPNTNGQHRRRLLTPVDMALPPNVVYIDDSEITLEPGDKIQARTDTANVVQYLISGVERDES